MGTVIKQLYRKMSGNMEYCFNIESSESLGDAAIKKLALLLADGFIARTVSPQPHFSGARVVELGPRLNFATAWSSNMVSICRASDLPQITRVER
ncbi:MAG: hypothetical protein GXP59_04700, partial [Deltaproteobacteria bacterium]|nr:hypothetical protein [Deltaproteobacteria bacterium]